MTDSIPSPCYSPGMNLPTTQRRLPPLLIPIVVAALAGFFLGAILMARNPAPASDQPDPKAAAEAVLQKLRTVYALPDTPEPAVATIADVEALKKQNPFYAKARNGDSLIVTA